MSPIKEFEAELNAGGKLESLKIVLSASDRRGLETLLRKYIESLKSNIQRRFDDCLGMLESIQFSIHRCCPALNLMSSKVMGKEA